MGSPAAPKRIWPRRTVGLLGEQRTAAKGTWHRPQPRVSKGHTSGQSHLPHSRPLHPRLGSGLLSVWGPVRMSPDLSLLPASPGVRGVGAGRNPGPEPSSPPPARVEALEPPLPQGRWARKIAGPTSPDVVKWWRRGERAPGGRGPGSSAAHRDSHGRSGKFGSVC